MMVWSKEEFAGRINQIAGSVPVDAGQLPQSIQMIVRDDGGYVGRFRSVRRCIPERKSSMRWDWPSPSYTLEEYDGGIRAVCQGVGHG